LTFARRAGTVLSESRHTTDDFPYRCEETAIHVIGCDAGSQSLKGLLLDDGGQVIAEAAAPYVIRYPHAGWAEQDPERWWDALRDVVHRLLASAGVAGSEVGAIGLATQVDGVVAVDQALEPLAPGIIWMDRRATRQTDRLRAAIPPDEVRGITGLNLDASHVAPKILWLRDEHPELVSRTRAYLPPGAWLVARLTGELVVDHANASSTLLYDIEQRTWSDRMLAIAGIDASMLGSIAGAHCVAGTLRPTAAEALGLTTACRVVVGTGDEHGACLGAGAIREDVVCDITGTAEPVAAASTKPVIDPTGLLETHGHADDRVWLIENPGFVSGGSVRWFLDLVDERETALDAAATVPPGSDGVAFLPTLSGATTPRWNEHARGVFFGLGLNHGRAHMGRALLEGCTFALRDLVDRLAELGLGGEELRVVGGGARSPLWLQMKADVTGRPVRVLQAREATALGAVQLAAVGAGLFRDLDEAVEALTRLEPLAFEPDPATRDAYDDAYGRYRRLFDAVEPLFTPGAGA
jgi:xylulokinase